MEGNTPQLSSDSTLNGLTFGHSKRVVRLVSSGSPSTVALGRQGTGRTTRRKQRQQRPAPFASVTMTQVNPAQSSNGTAPMPLFMIASAAEVKTPQGSSNTPAWRYTLGNFAAGAISGCAVEAALYPIDTIKTRLQAMIGGGGIKALLQSGGGKGLYAGIWGNLAGVAPASSIFISVYEPVKRAVQESVSEDQQWLGPVAAGAAAGAASSLVRVPTEVIKQRLQTKEFTSAITAMRTILAKEGVRGLYAGYGAFMLRDLPFDAIEFVAYEQVKKLYSARVGRELHPGETSIIGAMAGGFTGLVTTPLDVLKTRLMTQGASGRYKNLVDATIQIAKTEGFSAFLSGWQPRLIWISMGGFVFFPVLEATKKYFNPPAPEPQQLPVEPLVVEEAGKKKGKK